MPAVPLCRCSAHTGTASSTYQTQSGTQLLWEVQHISLCGAIGERVRLLTERLVVQAHPGTEEIPFKSQKEPCEAQ